MDFTRKQILFLSLGIFLILGAYLSVSQAKKGLIQEAFVEQGVPMIYVGPKSSDKPMPAVLIAHGFAGSKQLMLAYAYTLAKSGYACLLPDFVGHGANPTPMVRTKRDLALQNILTIAYQNLISRADIDANRIAILGHSMGSGAVMRQSLDHPDRYLATIAISPTSNGIVLSASAPKNLLLLAGEYEAPFVATAKRLLEESGGLNHGFGKGEARGLEIIDGVEHISILFHPRSHHASREWIDQSMSRSSDLAYADSRMLWFWLHVLGCLLLAIGLGPIWEKLLGERSQMVTDKNRRRLVIGMIIGPLVGIIGMFLLRFLFPNIAGIGGMLVGGAFALWLCLSGLAWMLLIGPISRPSQQEILTGVVLFCLFSLSYGWMAQQTWIPYFLNGPRLLRWLFFSLASLPWFLATGRLIQGSTGMQRFFWWLGQSVLIAVSSILLVMLVPELRFLALLIPVLPIVFGINFIAAAVVRRPWSFAIGSALFLGWQIAMLFPLGGA